MTLVIICSVMLGVAAALALYRMERGPSMLDRTVAMDILTAALMVGVGLEAAWHRRTDTIPIILALSLVGFIGSVTIARFSSVEPDDERQIRTAEEVAAEEAAAEAALLRSIAATARADAEAALPRGAEPEEPAADEEVRP